jgi:hypothetical protein
MDCRPLPSRITTSRRFTVAKAKQRRILSPDRRAVEGGFYDRIIPAQATRSACSRCGAMTAYLDQEYSQCLRCVLERRKANRQQEADPFPE